MRIGLLGGSFNPAHPGHRHVAELAARRLRLDQVWLLVSPGNPLKSVADMASLSDRLASARRMADSRRILATAVENEINTRFTVDTIRTLQQRFPRACFVWIMGADILEQFPRWRRWTEIASRIPVAVLPRPSYNHRALTGEAARRFRRFRRRAQAAPILARMKAPAWMFLPAAQHAASATAIRARNRRKE